MKLTNSQCLMRDDGLPVACILTPAQRAKAWAGVVIRSVPFANVKTTRDDSDETKAFRAQEEERRRLKSLASIAKMKAKFAAKANPVDYTKMRWDARRAKFVPLTGTKPTDSGQEPAKVREARTALPHQRLPTQTGKAREAPVKADKLALSGQLTKDSAERLAKLNGVWKDDYEKLRGTGRIVMTVGNLLRGIAKRGGTVKW